MRTRNRPPRSRPPASTRSADPKVGNESFAYATAAAARGKTAIFRFVNGHDIVTGLPTDVSPIEALVSDYRHVGDRGESEHLLEVWLQADGQL